MDGHESDIGSTPVYVHMTAVSLGVKWMRSPRRLTIPPPTYGLRAPFRVALPRRAKARAERTAGPFGFSKYSFAGMHAIVDQALAIRAVAAAVCALLRPAMKIKALTSCQAPTWRTW